MTRILASCLLAFATFVFAADPTPLTDEQMHQLALDTVTKSAPKAIVDPLQSKNPHLPAWKPVAPLPDWRFFCATLAQTPAAPVRQFVAVHRDGTIITPFTAERFSELMAKTDRTKWKESDYLSAALTSIHLTTTASQDGWKLLTKPADFTAITFNMASVGPGVEKQKKAAEQIQPPRVTLTPTPSVSLDEWHLIGGILSHWELTFSAKGVQAVRQQLGQFGGGGYD